MHHWQGWVSTPRECSHSTIPLSTGTCCKAELPRLRQCSGLCTGVEHALHRRELPLVAITTREVLWCYRIPCIVVVNWIPVGYAILVSLTRCIYFSPLIPPPTSSTLYFCPWKVWLAHETGVNTVFYWSNTMAIINFSMWFGVASIWRQHLLW